MRRVRFLFLLLLLGAALSVSGESWNVRRVAEFATDWFNNVKVSGDIAYCATRYGLVVMDVSDKSAPHVIERIPMEGRPVGIESATRQMKAGRHTATWSATDKSAGVYFVKVSTSGITRTRKVVLVK